MSGHTRALRRIYTEVAPTYERVNHVLTLGFDMRWRKVAAREAARGGGTLWLDVCSGTGEMAVDLRARAAADVRIVLVDLSWPMLARARRKTRLANCQVALSDTRQLPFADGSVDLITIGFATRNLCPDAETLSRHLREFHRVLKPGGRFVQLETSQPRFAILRRLLHAYAALAIRPIGYLLSGSRSGYGYLAHTIPRFHAAAEFSELLGRLGFGPLECRELLGGIAALHVARKPLDDRPPTASISAHTREKE